MAGRTTVNIYKIGEKQYSGVKIVTILAESVEFTLTKTTMPIRYSQQDVPDPKTYTLDLRIAPVIAYEITGYLTGTHQVITTSSVSSGTSVSIPVSTAVGFLNGDTITIVSPDSTTSESTTISGVNVNGKILTADLDNNYPAGSLITLTSRTISNPKADLIAIIKDLGVANLVYGSETIHIQFNKASIKETPSSKEQDEMYEVKLSVFETEDLI